MVTCLRSPPTRCGAVTLPGSAFGTSSVVPQALQNSAPAASAVSHDGQWRPTKVPHWAQKRAASEKVALQIGQLTVVVCISPHVQPYSAGQHSGNMIGSSPANQWGNG